MSLQKADVSSQEDFSRVCSLHEEIFAALYKHNPRWYDAIRYVYYLEIPQSAVAERMEISIEVLHSLLYRARKWIRKKFGVEYEEFLEL